MCKSFFFRKGASRAVIRASIARVDMNITWMSKRENKQTLHCPGQLLNYDKLVLAHLQMTVSHLLNIWEIKKVEGQKEKKLK